MPIARSWHSLTRMWNDVGPTLRRLAAVMWVSGFVIIGAGLRIDSLGWWSNRPFLSNLSSSLAGVLCGTPFALVVVQRISAHEAERLDRKSAVTLIVRATRHLAGAAAQLVPGQLDEDRIRVALEVLDGTQRIMHLDPWRRREAYDALSPALDEFADWLAANRTTLDEAVNSLATSWSIWREVAAGRLYLHEMEVVSFGLIGRIDTAVQQLRGLVERKPTVPGGDLITGSAPGPRQDWNIGNLFVAEEVTQRMNSAAVGKERDEYIRRHLSDLTALLREADRLTTYIHQVERSVEAITDIGR